VLPLDGPAAVLVEIEGLITSSSGLTVRWIGAEWSTKLIS
jgi:hypothetical protein